MNTQANKYGTEEETTENEFSEIDKGPSGAHFRVFEK